MKNKKVDLLFPTPIVHGHIDLGICEKIAILVLGMIDKEQLNKTKWATTKDNLNMLKEFVEIKNIIDDEMEDVATNVLKLEKNSLKMACMWANVHKNGSHHDTHQHPNSYMSGVLYLNIPKDSIPGNIKFTDPRPAKNMFYANFIEDSPLSARNWFYTPSTGSLFFFPSWLEHGTNRFETENENYLRISLSFNYNITKCDWNTMRV